MEARTFDYIYIPINDMKVITKTVKTGEVIDHILVQDEPLKDSQRFWVSLFARYGFNKSFFRYFDYAEVFDRISQVETNDRMRLCIERTTGSTMSSRLLAVSNPSKPLVIYDELISLLKKHDSQHINYSNGIVESTHMPRIGRNHFNIAGDMYENQFTMHTAIDGYGSPNLYLSLYRDACKNGMVGFNKHFRSQLTLGSGQDDVTPILMRALDSFHNDEGYAAIRQRIEAASMSWLSVYESQQLYKLLIKLYVQKLVNVNDSTVYAGTHIADLLAERAGYSGSPVIQAFHKMTGDPAEAYGLANLDGLSAKRQRTLPVNCKVYDAINFATEVATHYSRPAGGRELQSWVGNYIASEYDMEGTCVKFSDFADFLVGSKLSAGITGS